MIHVNTSEICEGGKDRTVETDNLKGKLNETQNAYKL